jgi:hypothetical protein
MVWIIKKITISLVIILLLNYTVLYLRDTFTKPMVRYINIPGSSDSRANTNSSTKETFNENNSTTLLNDLPEITLSVPVIPDMDTSPPPCNPEKDMKNELSKYLYDINT